VWIEVLEGGWKWMMDVDSDGGKSNVKTRLTSSPFLSPIYHPKFASIQAQPPPHVHHTFSMRACMHAHPTAHGVVHPDACTAACSGTQSAQERSLGCDFSTGCVTKPTGVCNRSFTFKVNPHFAVRTAFQHTLNGFRGCRCNSVSRLSKNCQARWLLAAHLPSR
jgi:hypothetical protein